MGTAPGRPFREVDHTGDLRVEIRGRDPGDLLRNAVESLYVMMGLPEAQGGTGGGAGEPLHIAGEDLGDALVRLLGELLYRAAVEGVRLLPGTVAVEGNAEAGCQVTVGGAWVDLGTAERTLEREIKAVTYHGLGIREEAGDWIATVVLDT